MGKLINSVRKCYKRTKSRKADFLFFILKIKNVIFNILLMRKPNTRGNGKNFSKKEEQTVWKKAQPTDDPNVCLDICGQEIHFNKYGDTNSSYGWEIDHIKPVAEGGEDELDNLQPLQWKANRRKGDKWPVTPKDYCQGK